LLDLERKYWQAMKDGDTQALLAMNDEPCVVAGASGVASIDAEEFTSMLRGATWKIEDFEIGDDAQVRMLSDDVAIVAYRVTEKLTVDDQPVTLEAADTSTWVRRDGRWLCALHTEALSGDPFGRDRTKPRHA
jgi:ketosteroid isomerase-like protein